MTIPLDVVGVADVAKAFKPKRLSRNRRPRPAVDHVSFRVDAGEVYGVIGANGSGKSTLIRILSTLLLPDHGTVHVFGHDAVRDPSAVRPLLNRVSADPCFFSAISAMENLQFFGKAYGLGGAVVRDRSEDILDRLSLERDRRRVPMLHLSRGQQQKVAVARAFLTMPQLMLLDEPTTGLDPRTKRDVQDFIAEVQRDHGVTILLTTHDMDEAEALCDRIGFLAAGALVAEGTPLQLRKQVAGSRPVDEVDMEAVFMALTGRSIDEDEDEDEEGATDGDG